MSDRYTFAVAAGTLLLASEIANQESDKERQEKMRKVVQRKRLLLNEAFPEVMEGMRHRDRPFTTATRHWAQDEATTLLIDLAFSNPFAPYDLKYRDQHFESALRKAAGAMSLDSAVVDNIGRARRDALGAHRHIEWAKITAWGLGGVAMLAAGGWLAAPIIGTVIGSAAGLTGAAATAHGLAILGGGSLALGGAGMAGGMWMVTGVGATLGLVGGGGSMAMLQLGAAQAKVELVKLQINFKVVLLGNQVEFKKAQEVVRSLTLQREEIRRLLDEERQLNEKNSARIKDMEATLTALEDSLKWMTKEAA